MPGAPRPGVFLEKRSYRRRRVVDGLRIMPILGAWLFLVPVLWPAGVGAPFMSRVLIYVFGAWVLLIVASYMLIVIQERLGGTREDETGGDDGLSE